MYTGVSKGVRAKAGVVSITVPSSKTDFASTPVLERRAHVPNDVVGMSIGDGRRENIPAMLQHREGECTEFARDHGVIRAKCRNQQPIERPADVHDAARVEECARRQRYVLAAHNRPTVLLRFMRSRMSTGLRLARSSNFACAWSASASEILTQFLSWVVHVHNLAIQRGR